MRHTRYARLPRKGWLAMECNVEGRHADAAHAMLHPHEEKQVWIPNVMAAVAPEALVVLEDLATAVQSALDGDIDAQCLEEMAGQAIDIINRVTEEAS